MINPIVDPQNAMRFDFTKSAICRRFCKVRLLKHPTGMFYPLRMTQRAASCRIVLYLLYPYQLRFANCASPTPCLAAARSRSGSDTTPWCHSLPSRRFATPGEGLVQRYRSNKSGEECFRIDTSGFAWRVLHYRQKRRIARARRLF